MLELISVLLALPGAIVAANELIQQARRCAERHAHDANRAQRARRDRSGR
jgi:hypothetical protein